MTSWWLHGGLHWGHQPWTRYISDRIVTLDICKHPNKQPQNTPLSLKWGRQRETILIKHVCVSLDIKNSRETLHNLASALQRVLMLTAGSAYGYLHVPGHPAALATRRWAVWNSQPVAPVAPVAPSGPIEPLRPGAPGIPGRPEHTLYFSVVRHLYSIKLYINGPKMSDI